MLLWELWECVDGAREDGLCFELGRKEGAVVECEERGGEDWIGSGARDILVCWGTLVRVLGRVMVEVVMPVGEYAGIGNTRSFGEENVVKVYEGRKSW